MLSSRKFEFLDKIYKMHSATLKIQKIESKHLSEHQIYTRNISHHLQFTAKVKAQDHQVSIRSI